MDVIVTRDSTIWRREGQPVLTGDVLAFPHEYAVSPFVAVRLGNEEANLTIMLDREEEKVKGYADLFDHLAEELRNVLQVMALQEGGVPPMTDLPPVPGGGGMAATGGDDSE